MSKATHVHYVNFSLFKACHEGALLVQLIPVPRETVETHAGDGSFNKNGSSAPHFGHTLKTEHCQHFMCDAVSMTAFNFVVIGPLQNHYSRYATVASFDLVLYATLYNLHINFHTVHTVFHPLLVCRGRDAVICGNSSCFGTIAMGRLGKLLHITCL